MGQIDLGTGALEMNESHDDQIARVELMAKGTNDTWDLSDNDVIALQTVLRERAELLKWLKFYADNSAGHPDARIAIGEAEGKRMRIDLPITAFACPPKCDHDFSGPTQELEPNSGMYSKICQKCGRSALDISMAEGI